MASHATRDHEEIQRWAADHGASPAVVNRTGGMLRFEFDPQHAEALTQVDWEEFFQIFDEKGLELVYDDKPGSRFHKIVYPETVEAIGKHRTPGKPASAGRRMQIVPRPGRAEAAEAEAEPAPARRTAKARTRRAPATSRGTGRRGKAAAPSTRSGQSTRGTRGGADRRRTPAATAKRAPRRRPKKAA